MARFLSFNRLPIQVLICSFALVICVIHVHQSALNALDVVGRDNDAAFRFVHNSRRGAVGERCQHRSAGGRVRIKFGRYPTVGLTAPRHHDACRVAPPYQLHTGGMAEPAKSLYDVVQLTFLDQASDSVTGRTGNDNLCPLPHFRPIA